MRWTWIPTWAGLLAGSAAAIGLALASRPVREMVPDGAVAAEVSGIGDAARDASPAVRPVLVERPCPWGREGGRAAKVEAPRTASGDDSVREGAGSTPEAVRAEPAVFAEPPKARAAAAPEAPEEAVTEGDLRFGLRQAGRDVARADRVGGLAGIALVDRARRALTAALSLPEMFETDTGAPTAERARTCARIGTLNERVLGTPDVPGLTSAYVVPRGATSWRLVERLPYGPNALLFWNHAGDLDPRRLAAGETLAVPLEPVSLRVDRAHRLLAVLIGGVLAREFPASVGGRDEPTPAGAFRVAYAVDRAGDLDPRAAETGPAWIGMHPASAVGPTLYLRGTDDPSAVGSAPAPWCRIVLRNPDVVEVLWWIAPRHGAKPYVLIQ